MGRCETYKPVIIPRDTRAVLAGECLRAMAAARHPQPSLLQPGTARSDDPPPERAATSVCATGPLLVTLGAALFAATNAASTGLYRRGETVVGYVMLIGKIGRASCRERV